MIVRETARRGETGVDQEGMIAIETGTEIDDETSTEMTTAMILVLLGRVVTEAATGIGIGRETGLVRMLVNEENGIESCIALAQLSTGI